MVEKGLESEVEEIIKIISDGNNFLLSGGAGSGKTYSLVQTIKEVIRLNPNNQIACITYTNAAIKEIEQRVNHANLRVSTIHDFLWDNIKLFQRELKKSLLHLINDDGSKIKNPNKESEDVYVNEFADGIAYKEYVNIEKGQISHDEVLILSNYMYKNYKLLCNILKDKCKYIFVDEYQDTSPLVVDIFLNHLTQSTKPCIIGFFGDSMQSIYPDGIGNLDEYIIHKNVIEVKKLQNRRNPMSVIGIANKTRNDKLTQEPSKDNDAPNMADGKCKQGTIRFLYSDNDNIDDIKATEYFKTWVFTDSKTTKELNLTHNLIAPKAGFFELMSIYDNDPIIEIKNNVVKKIKDNNIEIEENETFENVVKRIEVRDITKKLKLDVLLTNPCHKELFEYIKNYPFSEIRKMYLDKDSLIDDKKENTDDENKVGSKRDNLIKHLFKIQTLIQLYDDKMYNEFIRKTEYKIRSNKDKQYVKDIIEKIKSMSSSSIGDVIDFANSSELCKKDEKFQDFVKINHYLFHRVSNVKFTEFQKLFYYLEGYTPFSTQHKIKGAEFENVLVVLNNGGWNSYNFEYLFYPEILSSLDKSKQKTFPRILERTQKIFYVCCTRAKENLIVFYHNPSNQVLLKANEWFGKDNVSKI